MDRAISRPITLLGAALALMLAGVSAHASHAQLTPTPATGNYIDLERYIGDADHDRWVDARYYLKQNFDDICGDTICEGEYPNIEALGYRCSVDKTTGLMGECSWVFTASDEHVRASDGRIMANVHTWHCKTPLAPMTHASDFVQSLQGSRPLWARLPNTNATIWDGLITNCL